MRRQPGWAAPAVLALALCAAPAVRAGERSGPAAPGSGNLQLFLGGKFLDREDWSPTSSQPEFGFLADFTPSGWPLGIAADVHYSAVKGTADLTALGGLVKLRTDVAASTFEAGLGARKYWTLLPDLRAFFGGGGAFVSARWKPRRVGLRVEKGGDDGFGPWLGGGLVWAMSPHASLGAGLRWSSAAVTIAGNEIDAGGLHVGALAGYHW